VYDGGVLGSALKGLLLMILYMAVLGIAGMLSIPGLRTLLLAMLRGG
jgi:hypothetical protein